MNVCCPFLFKVLFCPMNIPFYKEYTSDLSLMFGDVTFCLTIRPTQE